MTSLLALAKQQQQQQQQYQQHSQRRVVAAVDDIDLGGGGRHDNENYKTSNQYQQQESTTTSLLLHRESTGHTIIPRDISLPGTSSSLLMIYFEENLTTEKDKRTARDTKGMTCLHLAVLKVCPIIFIRELIFQWKIDVNCVDYDGNTPLHISCAQKGHEQTKLLLASGANPSLMNGNGEVANTSFLTSKSTTSSSSSSSPAPPSSSRKFSSLTGCGGSYSSSTRRSGNANNNNSNNDRFEECGYSNKVTTTSTLPHYLPNRLITERRSLFSNALSLITASIHQPASSSSSKSGGDTGGGTYYDDSDSSAAAIHHSAQETEEEREKREHRELIEEAVRVARMEVAVPLVPVPWHRAPESCIKSLDSRAAYNRRKSSIASILRRASSVASASSSVPFSPSSAVKRNSNNKSRSTSPSYPTPSPSPSPSPSQNRQLVNGNHNNTNHNNSKKLGNASTPTTLQKKMMKLKIFNPIRPSAPHPLESRTNAVLRRFQLEQELDDGDVEGGGATAGSSKHQNHHRREVLDGIFASSSFSFNNRAASLTSNSLTLTTTMSETKEDSNIEDDDDEDDDESIQVRSQKYYKMIAEKKKHEEEEACTQQQHSKKDNTKNGATITKKRSSSSPTTKKLQKSLPVWFAIIPRVSEHEVETSFLVGGMIRFHGEFQFGGNSFCLAEMQTYDDIFCARFSSTLRSKRANDDDVVDVVTSSYRDHHHHRSLDSDDGDGDDNDNDFLLQQQQDPIVVELFTATKDTSLPTVVRCFRDTNGLVAAHEGKKELLRQSTWEKKKAQVEARNAVEDKKSDDAIMIQTSESKATHLLMRFLVRLKYLHKFQNIITLLADHALKVKRFLRRCVHRVKFAKCILYFVAASFFRYALAELDKFPRHHCALYRAIAQVIRTFVQTFSDQRFVSRNLLFIAVDAAFRNRERRIFTMLRNHRNVPLDIIVQHRRERFIWCLTLEEIIEACIQPMMRNELLPVIQIAQQRDGLLPRELLYSIRTVPNSKEIFEELARSKVKRTMMDIVQSFSSGRRNYFEERVLAFGRHHNHQYHHQQEQEQEHGEKYQYGGENTENANENDQNNDHDNATNNNNNKNRSTTLHRTLDASPFRRPSPYLQRDFHKDDTGDVFGLTTVVQGRMSEDESGGGGANDDDYNDDQDYNDVYDYNHESFSQNAGGIGDGNIPTHHQGTILRLMARPAATPNYHTSRNRSSGARRRRLQQQQHQQQEQQQKEHDYVQEILQSLQRRKKSPPPFGPMTAFMEMRKKKLQREREEEERKEKEQEAKEMAARHRGTRQQEQLLNQQRQHQQHQPEKEVVNDIISDGSNNNNLGQQLPKSKILTRFPPIVKPLGAAEGGSFALGRMKKNKTRETSSL